MSNELTEGLEQPNVVQPEPGSSTLETPNEEVDFGFELESNNQPDPAAAPPQQPGSQPEAIDQGRLTRIEQDSARKGKVLQALGLDPNSNLIDQFEQGLLTEADLRARLAPQPVSQPAQPAVKSPLDTLKEIQDRVHNNKDATLDDFEQMAAATFEALRENEQRTQQTEMQRTAQQCQDAVYSVFDSAETQLEDETLRMTEREIFMAATDRNVTADAQKLQNPSQMLNPQTYGFYANKTAESLAALKEAYIELGKQQALQGKIPAPAEQIIPPASPGGGAMPKAPTVKVNVDNMAQAREQYLRSRKQV